MDSGCSKLPPHTTPLDSTTLTLLETNPSHMPVIENAIARVSVFSKQDAAATHSQKPLSIMYLVNAAANCRWACMAKVFNTASARSQCPDFR